MHISDYIDLLTLIWVLLQTLSIDDANFWSKVMMSVVKQRPMLVMAGYSCTGVSGLKNRYISWYLMLVAFSSPVKLSKIAFCMTFLSKVCSCTANTISVSCCKSLEVRLF